MNLFRTVVRFHGNDVWVNLALGLDLGDDLLRLRQVFNNEEKYLIQNGMDKTAQFPKIGFST